MSDILHLDLFCRVVDNYGDIGVCWRLARQLAAKPDIRMRLVVDDMDIFSRIDRRIDASLLQQNLDGVEVLAWRDDVLPDLYGQPGDAVLEGFACTLPDFVIDRMQRTHSVWIDFEYLTAESWADDCHARPSLHPTGLIKSLFFPGFSAGTGGLLREDGLIDARKAFVNDPEAQKVFRARIGLPLQEPGQIDASLFCYQGLPFTEFEGVRLFIPEGVAPELTGPDVFRFPFLTSEDYDRLLWTCDLNFVRGEDSWIRAVWAGKPFFWQAYRQEDNAHFIKLNAFLDRYLQGLEPAVAESLANFHAMWNEGDREGKTASRLWDSFLPLLPQISDHAISWSGIQAGSEDCATNLIRFIRAQQNL